MRFRRDKSDQTVSSITASGAKRPEESWIIPCEILQFYSIPPGWNALQASECLWSDISIGLSEYRKRSDPIV